MRRRRTQKPKQTQIVFARFLFIVALMVIWMGAISVRLVHLQVNQREFLVEEAQKQRRKKIQEKRLRGSIYDRDGNELAISLDTESLFVNPDKLKNLEADGARLANLLKQKPQDVVARLKKSKANGKKHVRFAADLGADLAQKIKDHQIEGVTWEKDQMRSYPHDALAAHIVGFSNLDDAGQAGVELSREAELKGEAMKGYQIHDRLGRVYDETQSDASLPKDVYLTIDIAIQYQAERALQQGIEAANAKGGTAIVMDPRTGEILALASAPSFNPNKYGGFASDMWKNRAVQDTYSPGSVFKLVTYGAALQEKLLTPETEIDCGKGYIQISGRTEPIRDKHPAPSFTAANALAISSNVAAIKTAQQLGKDKLYGYTRRFGFGRQTGVELPAEAVGLVRPVEKWNGDSLAMMSIGYEMGVTSLQLASAFAAVANDGVRVQPHLVKEIRDVAENKSFPTYPEKYEVINPTAARDLRMMLKRVVERGTAVRAQLDGYSSAGKTGTAWKYDAKTGYDKPKFISSFIGFAPAENPAVVIAVMVDEPQGGARDGGQVAAPVFKAIAEQVLPKLNVVPDLRIRPNHDNIFVELKSHKPQEVAEDLGLAKAKPPAVKKEQNKKSDENKDSKKPDQKTAAIAKTNAEPKEKQRIDKPLAKVIEKSPERSEPRAKT